MGWRRVCLLAAAVIAVVAIGLPGLTATRAADKITVRTDPATTVTASTARLNGTLVSLPAGTSANVSFQWGTTVDSRTAAETAPREMTVPGTFQADLSSLSANTTYYFRAKGVGQKPDDFGLWVPFTTSESPPAAYALTVNVVGSGSVTRNPDQATYNSGTSVQLAAVPAAGWTFSSWSGDLTGTQNPTSITMDANKSVTATFIQNTDTTAPAAVSDLTAGSPTSSSITLTWTAPGDDGMTGTAARYEIRSSTSIVTEANWTAVTLAGQPSPKAPANPETFTVTGLSASTTYFFALKTADEVPNWSGLSNSTSGTTSATAPPPTGGGGGGFGGGGGGGPTGPGVTNIAIYTNGDGVFNLAATPASEDHKVQLDIAKGVLAKTKDGGPLKSVSIVKTSEPTQAPADSILAVPAYDFGPDGATFDPPITLEFFYDRSTLPQGLSENNLSIVTWDTASGTWMVVPSAIESAAGRIATPVAHFSRYAVVARARPAAFTLAALSISQADARPGDEITVSVRVANQGDLAGSYSTSLKVDGKNQSTQEITVAGNSEQQVTFTFAAETIGRHQVDVNGLTGSFAVTGPAPGPAVFAVSLTISTNSVDVGQAPSVSVTVKNTGESAGTRSVTLLVNGKTFATQDVDLPPQSVKIIQFTLPSEIPGTYSVEVDGQTAGYLVNAPLVIPQRVMNWWLIGGVVFAVVAASSFVAFRLKERTAYIPPIPPRVQR